MDEMAALAELSDEVEAERQVDPVDARRKPVVAASEQARYVEKDLRRFDHNGGHRQYEHGGFFVDASLLASSPKHWSVFDLLDTRLHHIGVCRWIGEIEYLRYCDLRRRDIGGSSTRTASGGGLLCNARMVRHVK